LIRAVVDIACGLEKKTIGEIIGDDETVSVLTRLGVDYGQGYHLGRPGPLDEVFAAAPTRRTARSTA
jgi:EAL domain-containing protein (putative c-di-GMP-specific phosphodiesterase class I)